MFEFKNLNYLTDGEIDLIIEEKVPYNPLKDYLPSYNYKITKHDSIHKIGEIDLRIGFNEDIYYAGNIGYMIKKEHRGSNYAYKACKLIKTLALKHYMDSLIITCNPDNYPSIKTCNKLGAEFKETVLLPKYTDMYREGERKKHIYIWRI